MQEVKNVMTSYYQLQCLRMQRRYCTKGGTVPKEERTIGFRSRFNVHENKGK